MIEPKFQSVIAKYIDNYLEECRLIRHSLDRTKSLLSKFDAFLVNEGVTSECITLDIFERWVDTFRNLLCERTIYHHRSEVILLLEYMRSVGVQCEVPRRAPFKIKPFIPYIFTEKEMQDIFRICDSWRDKCHKPEGALMAMPLFLRILYSTGMRYSEVANLKNKDVDLRQHTIRIIETKNGCERIAPINSSLTLCIEQYLKYRGQLPITGLDAPDAYFIVNHKGRRLCHTTFNFRFHKIIKEAHVKGNNPKTICRIHDIRHTSCVHVMHKLIKEGRDLYTCIPAISAFMGHKSIFSTELYMRFTAEMFPEMVQMSEDVTAPISDVISNALKNEDDE